ncbi:hypothetical protein A5788_03250 [Gordonia sp. 852002-50816_SCH5313054-c]|uniref:hypothetical protein n=1 Tax=unclassified Gordonia (in: high G+C Gram-positive bacteria) TaxID=2657482 RepID=UPI0007E9E965|nr:MULTISPECIES: hypothetical protein [unclassified Gordonia (in: high G+C Gram-positive bacteria)]OBC09817.1 hypothetical protein A5786_06325 [Gordonia sp. 852002-50816_SCH5313054-a]OBC17924.1 hypothetical protein A5788_03250 [Gordonia sp. 852002-50816_SCH5313054-c]
MTSTSSGKWAGTYAGILAVLGIAFVFAPAYLAGGHYGGYGDNTRLVQSMRNAFIDYSGSGSAVLPDSLRTVVDYWARYHVAKAVIAALALLVLCSACRRLWVSYQGRSSQGRLAEGRGRTVGYVVAGVAASLGTVSAAALLMANIQGAIAPLSSAVSLLPAQRDSSLAGAIDAVRHGIATPGASPVADHLVADFARYHVVVAVLSAVFVAILGVLAVRLWRGRRAASNGIGALSYSTLPATATAATTLTVAAAVLVLCVANISSALEPARALSLFFAGG